MTAFYQATHLQLSQQAVPPLQEVHEVQQPIQPVQPVYNSSSTGPDRPRRTRRRYEEVPRIYMCNHGDCDRGYSTLNHLNTHVTNKNHGPRRLPGEFQILRARLRQETRSRNTQVANASYANEMATRMATGQVPPPAHVMATMEQHSRHRHEALHVPGAVHLPANQARLAPGPPFFDMFQVPATSSAADRPHAGQVGQVYGFDEHAYHGQGYNYAVYAAPPADQDSPYGASPSPPVAASSAWSPAHAQLAYPAAMQYQPFHFTQLHTQQIHSSGWSGPNPHDDANVHGQHRPSDASSVPTMSSDTTRPTTATTAVESPSGDYTYFAASSASAPFDTYYNMGATCKREN